MRDDGIEEDLVRVSELLEADRHLQLLGHDRELTLEHVRHEVLLQVVHHERHVSPELEQVRVAVS